MDLRACFQETTKILKVFARLNDSNAMILRHITILQGEMHGYYTCGLWIGDWRDGLGEFENITHTDVKNGVGSAIKIAENQDPNIRQQGRNIGKKSVWQKKFWSNTIRTSKIPNIKSDAYLPQSINNTVTVMDCFDVPTFEKSIIQEGFNSGLKNDTNCVFLNNVTNI